MQRTRPKGFVPAVIAGLLGTVLEYYDLTLVGVISVIAFPAVFYPELNPTVALGLSISAFGVTFVSRPLGGVLFGYLGDKRGRKFTFIWTMIITSIAVLGVTIMPPYSVIGYAGIILIIICRLVQGVGLGGEFGIASVFVMEFSENSVWRGFWSSWVPNGIMIGALSMMVANILTTNLMPMPQYLLYGWRVLFGVGVLLGVMAIVLRYKVGETELFQDLEAKREVSRSPLKEVIESHGRKCLKLAWMALPPTTAFSVMTFPFGISYLRALGADANFGNLQWSGAGLLTIFAIMCGGVFSDRIGRRKTYLMGIAIGAIAILSYFPLLRTLNFYVATLATFSVLGAGMFNLSAWPAWASESFPTKVRSTGTSVGYQLASLIVGLIISLVIPYILLATGGPLNGWPWVMTISFIVFGIAFILGLMTKETKGVKLSEV